MSDLPLILQEFVFFLFIADHLEIKRTLFVLNFLTSV